MRVQAGEVELNYTLSGERGPVIVLTHGIGGSGENFDPIVPALAKQFRVLTWDVRGFGQSQRPATGYSVKQFAADLAALLDALGIDKAIIGGTSMGGTITQRFILDFPEKTLATIIMSTSSEVNERAKEGWMRQADAIERDGMAAWVRASRAPHVTDEYVQEHPDVREAEERRIRLNPDGRVYAQVARAVADYNYTAELESVRVPALVLVGSTDKQTPPGGSVIISRRIPGAELHIIEGPGHSLPTEAPETVIDLITAFVQRVTTPATTSAG